MVGRKLPNMRPYGEDHCGASGGNMMRTAETGELKVMGGALVGGSWKRWPARRTMVWTRTELDWRAQ